MRVRSGFSTIGCSLLLAIASVAGVALPARAQQPETLSLLGKDLYAPPLSAGERRTREEALLSARAEYGKNRANVDAILAVARADMALGHVGDAVELLTRGLEAVPDEPHLYLERGRDLIVIRKFELAQRDLRKAAETQPDAQCALGLALYLAADFPHARESYGRCADPGIFAYLSERRAGSTTVPRPAVPADPAASSTSVIRMPGSVLPGSAKRRAPMSANYMDAVERLIAGKKDPAKELLKEIVEKHGGQWMEPVYIAAEMDYSKLRKPTAPSRRR